MSRRSVSTLMLALILVGLVSSLTELSLKDETSVSNRAFASLVSDYQNVTNHEGDLIINGTQTYVIENCTYVQTGNIGIEDSATLLLRNGKLVIIKSPSSDGIWVKDKGCIKIQNATLEPDFSFGVSMSGSSSASVNMVAGLNDIEIFGDSIVNVSRSTLNRLCISDKAKASLSTSHVGVLVLSLVQVSDVKVIDLKPGFCGHWSLHENETISGTMPGYQLVVENTTVDNWSVGVDYQTSVTIENSRLGLSLRIHNANLHLSEMNPGYLFEWSLGSLSIRNSTISSWFLEPYNSEILVTNSSVSFCLGGRTNATIQDSKIGLFSAWYHSGIIRVDGVTSVGMYVGFAYCNTTLCGDFDFSDAQGIEWFSTNITRSFGVLVEDEVGESMSNVALILESKDCTSVWEGSTDALGSVGVDVLFSGANYTDRLVLKISERGFYNVSENVSFLSSTPIIINLIEKPVGDINEDRTVNIVDVTLVARSFNCVPTDEGWNELCDLNKDNVINIVDITLVAKDYGKKV